MGVDTSTKTGYVVLGSGATVNAVGVIHYRPESDRFARFARYAYDLVVLVEKYDIELVVFEGYSYAGKFVNSLQYELGAVLRYVMWEKGVPFVEVAPTSLKKFVTGKGNAKKDLMLLSVYKRWDFDTEDDNEADAYGLAQFGRALHGYDTGVPAVNLTAVETILASDQPYCKQLQVDKA